MDTVYSALQSRFGELPVRCLLSFAHLECAQEAFMCIKC